MQTFIQLLRLWRMYAWLDFVWVTRSFKFFVMYYIGDGVIMLAGLTSTLLLAETFDGIGMWTKHQVAFMLGYGALVEGLPWLFCGYNVLYIGRRLGRGQFDHTLIQPQPLWLALATDGFNPFGGSIGVVTGLSVLIWAWWQMSLNTSPIWWVMLLLNLSASALVMWAFAYLWGSLAFRAPRAAEEINTPSLQMMNALKFFPLDGLGGWTISALLTVVPVGFIAWYPCRHLLGLDPAPYAGFVTPLAALVMGALAVWSFASGLAHYRRVGSNRYRAMGHRG